MATHFRKLMIGDVRRETADCVSVSFDIPAEWQDEFRFCQGQNITLRMTMDGAEIRRSYSICSSPTDGELRIAVKKVTGGLFSTYANDKLQQGHSLEVLPPSGKFYTELNPANRKHYLAFAAGSGITPVISLIKATLATEPESSFTLVYGNRNRGSIIFRDELEALKNRYMNRLALHHILSREDLDVPVYQGRIDVSKCEELCAHLIDLRSAGEIFLCGPEQMIFSLKDWLETRGVERKKIHFELFHTLDANPAAQALPAGAKISASSPGQSTANRAAPAAVSQVTIKLDGLTHHFSLPYEGASVLEAAMMEGIDLPYACKGGVCCTCRAKLLEGKVEMDHNYALEADELEAGFVLTCQSHPRSDKVVVDFDSK